MMIHFELPRPSKLKCISVKQNKTQCNVTYGREKKHKKLQHETGMS